MVELGRRYVETRSFFRTRKKRRGETKEAWPHQVQLDQPPEGLGEPGLLRTLCAAATRGPAGRRAVRRDDGRGELGVKQLPDLEPACVYFLSGEGCCLSRLEVAVCQDSHRRQCRE